MSTYEHDLLTTRFAALAPRPLPGDWDDVVDRSGALRPRRPLLARSPWRGGRGRKLVVALAVTVLVAAVAAAAYGTVRVLFLDKGFIGLPPVGASPSAPEGSELLVEFIGRSATFGDRLNRVWLYTDGRMIWLREGAVAAGANESTSGFLEQRLTPDGVERLRSELLATGLFDRDRRLLTAHSPWGTVRVRHGDTLVRVGWLHPANAGPPPGASSPVVGRGHTAATPEQVKALEQVDALLADPASQLPAKAWEDPRIKAYVASRYAICWEWRPNLDPGAGTVDASRILGVLPPPLADALRARWRPYVWPRWWRPGPCTVVPTEEARTVARALDDAGLERRGGGKGRGAESLYRLAYGLQPPNVWPGSIFFEPVLPHGEWVCTPCG